MTAVQPPPPERSMQPANQWPSSAGGPPPAQLRSAAGATHPRIPNALRQRDPNRPPAPDRGRRTTLRWARWLHVYSSMVALLIVLFFGLTGLTLNHPSWTFGDSVDTKTVTGQLPVKTTLADGSVDFLSISEFVRDNYGIKGHVDSLDVTNGRGAISYKKPGYAADLFFDVGTGSYELTTEQQGWMAVLNDLHKGRDATSPWRWLIDASAVFLVLISLTGLTMQFLLRKRRRTAFILAGLGAVACAALALVTLL